MRAASQQRNLSEMDRKSYSRFSRILRVSSVDFFAENHTLLAKEATYLFEARATVARVQHVQASPMRAGHLLDGRAELSVWS